MHEIEVLVLAGGHVASLAALGVAGGVEPLPTEGPDQAQEEQRDDEDEDVGAPGSGVGLRGRADAG
ncbi:hypothetical protein PUR21_21830 [Methylorubrum rhodesianum]|uniref:Uncharacterized protein n=1 Tax=Methylorubrum rhodesianum TaxID=29427 RepID=A0ABU9ZG04_9HYPH